MAPPQGVLGLSCSFLSIEIHRNIFKNLLLRNNLTQILEIWYAALACGPLPCCLNEVSGSTVAPPGLNYRYTEKIIRNLLQNHLVIIKTRK